MDWPLGGAGVTDAPVDGVAGVVIRADHGIFLGSQAHPTLLSHSAASTLAQSWGGTPELGLQKRTAPSELSEMFL